MPAEGGFAGRLRAHRAQPRPLAADEREDDVRIAFRNLREKRRDRRDDAKFAELNNQMNDCLKKAIEPFERAFSIAEDPEIKRGCAEYLKQIYFRFRDEKPEYQANYEKYHKFIEESAN